MLSIYFPWAYIAFVFAVTTSLMKRESRGSLSDRITTDRTCRWTNCGEPCPSGSDPVPRQNGEKGEMIWDHTHCAGNGMQTFCCPHDRQAETQCRQRGIGNSHHCQPGCSKDDVEVGTYKYTCNTGHQSACCTWSPGVEAYGKCRWVGSAPRCSIADPRQTSFPRCVPSFTSTLCVVCGCKLWRRPGVQYRYEIDCRILLLY